MMINYNEVKTLVQARQRSKAVYEQYQKNKQDGKRRQIRQKVTGANNK